MAFKILAFAAFLATCSASVSVLSSAHPLISQWGVQPVLAQPLVRSAVVEQAAPAHYDFGYSVSDPSTGDHKGQVESRRGDAVQGQYSLLESDGTQRIVDYTADDVNGFNAVVRKEPVGVAVAPTAQIVSSPVLSSRLAVPAWNGINAWNGLNTWNGLNEWNGNNAPLLAQRGLANPWGLY